jgi:hypothetical protein
VPRDIQEADRRDKILEECEEYLKDSRRLREIAALKATGRTLTGSTNPSAISKKFRRKKDRKFREKLPKPDKVTKGILKEVNKLEGIDEAEIQRRKGSGECLRCAWPADRKGAHRVVNCIRPVKLDIGTASFPKDRKYPKIEQVHQEVPDEEESFEPSNTEESSDDSF